jgi:pantoate--beta-alanine ligase
MSLLINHISDIKTQISQWKKQGLKIGLVPTMGALHIGHESLIKKARETCDKVIVSIFINPTQFGPNEDFDKYPRNLEKDAELCKANNVDVIFAPSVDEIYPDMDNLTIVVPPKSFQDKLCGKSRPSHFDGVALVVTKLFNITQSDVAFFGLKDAQQFFIIKKLVKDLNISIELVGCPIIRDFDGLAMSSRNVYLSVEDRQKALCLNKMVKKIQELYIKGEKNVQNAKKEALKLLEDGVNIEYFEFVSTDTLCPKSGLESGILVAIAVKLNNIRLIDNIILEK